MKLITIVVLASAVSLQAQQAPKPPSPPPPTPMPTHPQTPAPIPQPIPVEPKHSEATANLRAAEAEKHDLQTQSQAIVAQANIQLANIRSQLAQKDKEVAEVVAVIKKENDFGDDVTYAPEFQQQDGTTVAGHWQKMPEKKEK